MDDPFDSLLSERIRAHARMEDDSDWLDVERGARRLSRAGRRRKVALIAAALVAAVGLLAAPGWGLGFRVADLFSGESAPPDVQATVHGADVGAPSGMAPGIEANQTHKLMAITLADGRQATLWVAPTSSSGLCVYVQRGSLSGGPGCGPSEAPTDRVDWSIQGPAEHDNAFLMYGRVPDAADRLDLSFADGTTVQLILAKGFFLYEIPSNHVGAGHRPSAFVAYRSEGQIVARTVLPEAVNAVFERSAP